MIRTPSMLSWSLERTSWRSLFIAVLKLLMEGIFLDLSMVLFSFLVSLRTTADAMLLMHATRMGCVDAVWWAAISVMNLSLSLSLSTTMGLYFRIALNSFSRILGSSISEIVLMASKKGKSVSLALSASKIVLSLLRI